MNKVEWRNEPWHYQRGRDIHLVMAPSFGTVAQTLGPEEAKQIVAEHNALHWRKWPEEKPTESGLYIVARKDRYSTDFWGANLQDWDELCSSTEITHWLPIPPLVEEE